MKFRIYTVVRETRYEDKPPLATELLGSYLLKGKARKAEVKEINTCLASFMDSKIIDIREEDDKSILKTYDGWIYTFHVSETEVIV